VLWPSSNLGVRFECADYFRPQERLTPQQMSELVEFLNKDRPQGAEVDRGRYGFANYLKAQGPLFVREMPRGYVVELVQLLLNKSFLQFRKGKVSFRPTTAGRWKSALENALSPDLHSPDDTSPLPSSIMSTPEQLPSRRLSATSTDSVLPSSEPYRPRSLSLPEGKALSEFAASGTPFLAGLDDPVDVLALKCSDKRWSAKDTLGTGERSVPGSPSKSPGFRMRPLYHYEKSGEQHAPLWVAVVTLDIVRAGDSEKSPFAFAQIHNKNRTYPSLTGPSSPATSFSNLAMHLRPKRFRSTRKGKKLEAQQEAALRALESGYWDAQGHEDGSEDFSNGESQMLDDPVVVFDRLLQNLEQAPAVYTMDSSITQHGSGSRTMWTCGLQLALRPRPAHLAAGVPIDENEPAVDASGVTYPTLKWSASQAKKFDAKCQVAAHVLHQLQRSQNRYPLLFQITPAPSPLPKSALSVLQNKQEQTASSQDSPRSSAVESQGVCPHLVSPTKSFAAALASPSLSSSIPSTSFSSSSSASFHQVKALQSVDPSSERSRLFAAETPEYSKIPIQDHQGGEHRNSRNGVSFASRAPLPMSARPRSSEADLISQAALLKRRLQPSREAQGVGH